MPAGQSIEILDLRHFTAAMLRGLLETESSLWHERLHWDYRNSIKLLNQYLDNRILPGYAATLAEQVIGYGFCVYEDSKAVIGDVFSMRGQYDDPAAAREAAALEEKLLEHILELVLNSPQIERIESQMLIHPSGTLAPLFRQAGFEIFRRLFLVQPLTGHWNQPRLRLPSELELRPWRDEDLTPAARLICEAYRLHPDSLINDQYRTTQGSLRFLNNIVRYAGCGVFSPTTSHVLVHRTHRELAGLILGSRVSPVSGHITQICIHPEYRRRGLARGLLELAAFHFMRMGVSEVSLTVTEENSTAVRLYLEEGYNCVHSFDAAVWQRSRMA
jgi:ribosomal protein S18 acetylase RimI-like enzyme